MRLTCPRCGAQYEIAAAAIPAAGREVECSACSHVWFQPGQPKAAAPYDPEARPALNRPLNKSILAILRDETARELQARQADVAKPAPGADQNIANRAAGTPPEPAISGTGPSGIAETVPTAEPAAEPSYEPTGEASAEPVAAPAEPTAETTADTATDTPTDAPAEIPVMADADWPATTLTVAPAGPAGPAPTPEPVEPGAEGPPTAASDAPEPSDPAPFEAPNPAPEPPITDEPTPEAPAPEAEERPEPVVAALPDAAELAATLTRPGPPPALSPANAEATPDAAEPASTGPAAEAAVIAAPLPVVATAKRGSGYASGFGLAAMLALGLVAVYALAPRVTADEDGGLLAEWRQDIDRGRLWLHDRIIGQ